MLSQQVSTMSYNTPTMILNSMKNVNMTLLEFKYLLQNLDEIHMLLPQSDVTFVLINFSDTQIGNTPFVVHMMSRAL